MKEPKCDRGTPMFKLSSWWCREVVFTTSCSAARVALVTPCADEALKSRVGETRGFAALGEVRHSRSSWVVGLQISWARESFEFIRRSVSIRT